VQALEKRLMGKVVILSVSRLDYTKGIVEQLEAFRLILKAGRRAVYKLVVSPSRENLGEYKRLKQDIQKLVNQINNQFSTPTRQVVEYEYRNMEFDELTSWYCRADVMLVAPLRDGMNLVAKEYIATKPQNDGVLVLSKTAGVASQLQQALLVDPTNPVEMAQVLERAISMPMAERRRRHQALRTIVQEEDAAHWATSFRDALLITSRDISNR
jgi:trehalose-6-phosphate synthase